MPSKNQKRKLGYFRDGQITCLVTHQEDTVSDNQLRELIEKIEGYLKGGHIIWPPRRFSFRFPSVVEYMSSGDETALRDSFTILFCDVENVGDDPRRLLELIETLDEQRKDLGGSGLTVQAVSPNWLASDASDGGATGGPGGRPVPFQGKPDQAPYDFPQLRFRLREAELYGDGTDVDVVILDTAPHPHDLIAAYKEWRDGRHPLISTLLGPDSRLRLYPATYDELLRMGSLSLNKYDYEMTDHGLFVAGIVHTIAPHATIHLIEVLNPFGVGDLETIVRGLEKAYNVIRKPGGRLVVNCSLMLELPLESKHRYAESDSDPDSAFEQAILDMVEADPSGYELKRQGYALKAVCDRLNQMGSQVIAAAGNDWRETSDRPHAPKARYPAGFLSAVGVGALPKDSKLDPATGKHAASSYSNLADTPASKGIATLGGEEGEGQGVLGLYLGEFPGGEPNSTKWAWWAGTSFASSIVTGAIAAVLSGMHSRTQDAITELYGRGIILNDQTDAQEDALFVGQDYALPREQAVGEALPPESTRGLPKQPAKELETAAKPPLPPETSESPPRYADFTFYHDGGRKPASKLVEGQTLRAGQWYQLEIAVRVRPSGIPAEGMERRPIREPKQKEDVQIWVTLQEDKDDEAEGDRFEIENPIQPLTLPPLGDSKQNAVFRVRPLRPSQNKDDFARLRVRLYYKFNLLEVGLIRSEVASGSARSDQSQFGLENPIVFKQERLERNYLDFDNVQPRVMHIDIITKGKNFLFTFTFYNATEQQVVFEKAPTYLSDETLEDVLVRVRETWYRIAMSDTFARQLEGDLDEFIGHVRELARLGRELWIKLFRHERGAMWNIGQWLKEYPPEKDGIVQISLEREAANFVFPWALLYDGDIPDKAYELPNPDGFWGIRYCIEQQQPYDAKGTDEPISLAGKLKIGFMLWDQFKNAKDEVTLMEGLMRRSQPELDALPPITSAKDCYALLKTCDAHILYFYTHGYTRHRQADIGVGGNLDLFIRTYEQLDPASPLRERYQFLYKSIKGNQFELDRSWIELRYGRLYLDELYFGVDPLQSRPLVVLNMCESAQITPSLDESFIHFFLSRGAVGVIGTECPMTIEFAHPFAQELLPDLLAGESVGHALLNARRHFMALKNPLGLAYTLFGSATICFRPPRFEIRRSTPM